MDYEASIEHIYEHLENGHVDKAVMGSGCLRLARHLKDHLSAATFLRELYPGKHEVARVLLDDTAHLKEDARRFLSSPPSRPSGIAPIAPRAASRATACSR